eukprot:g3950.t1
MPRKKAAAPRKRAASTAPAAAAASPPPAAAPPLSVEQHEAGVVTVEMQGRREYMEDRTLVVSKSKKLGPHRSVFGVFDGHGGQKCSQYIKDRLMANMPALASKPSVEQVAVADVGSPPGGCSSSAAGAGAGAGAPRRRSTRTRSRSSSSSSSSSSSAAAAAAAAATTRSGLEDALYQAVVTTDARYCKMARSKDVMDGSTCVVCMTSSMPGEDVLVVSNTGDSRAVLIRADGSATALSDDHKPERKDEQARIAGLGGQVLYDDIDKIWRVDGMLAISRAVGDYYLKPYVTGEPELKTVARAPADRFVVLASDGLWDEVTAEEVGATLLKEHALAAAPALVRLAYDRGSEDNISIVVVPLGVSSGKSSAVDLTGEGNDDDDDDAKGDALAPPPGKRAKR